MDPGSEEQGKAPSDVASEGLSQHECVAFGLEDVAVSTPGPTAEPSAWEVPPEEEFGIEGHEDLEATQAQELPPEWAGSNWEGWGSTLHHRN